MDGKAARQGLFTLPVPSGWGLVGQSVALWKLTGWLIDLSLALGGVFCHFFSATFWSVQTPNSPF